MNAGILAPIQWTAVTRGVRAVPILFVLVVWSLTTHGKFSDSGDEPHYLMVAESLLSDGDFDVANNYARGDGRWFGADYLEAGPHARVTRTGSTWSTHDIGLPVLILPVYAAATRVAALVPEDALQPFRQTRGLFAYSLVSLAFIALTAAALSLLVSAFGRGAEPGAAIAATLAAGLSPPVLSHAFLIFPETPTFFVVCAALWLMARRTDEITPTRVALVTAAIGLLPWLHRKYSFFIFGLAIAIAQRHSAWLYARSPRYLAGLAALLVLPEAALHASTLYLWGNLGGPQMLEGLPFSVATLQRGIIGLLADRERGLVAYAPIYLLVPTCWALMWRQHAWLLLPTALLFVPMASFAVWSAGFSPAARYLVPLIPLLAAPVAGALANPVVSRVALALAVFQAAVTAVVWQFPRTLWPEEIGGNAALAKIPWVGPTYAALLPSMLTGDPIRRGWLTVGAVALGTAVVVWFARRRHPGVHTTTGRVR